MADLLDSIKILGAKTEKAMEAGKQAFKQTIDEAANKTYEKIKVTMPYKEGDLKKSFVKVSEIKGSKKRSHRYGWYLKFEGYNDRGVPFQLIANTLNRGSIPSKKHGAINGNFFIDNAVTSLKGLDAKIVKNMQISISDYMDKELT